MGELELLQNVGLMIITAAVMILLLRKTNTPSIVLYILAGLLLGPVLGWINVPGEGSSTSSQQALVVIADLGIALLLFLVGLELSFNKIRDVGKVSMTLGLSQVAFITVLGFVIAWLLRYNAQAAIFIAVALTNSSTVLVVKLLDQKRETNETYGHIIVGLNLVKDVVLIVLLAILVGIGSAEGQSIGQTVGTLGKVGSGMLVMLVVALFSSRYLLPVPLRWASHLPATLLIWSLTWCMLFVVTAQWLGLSPAIGAFLAGISLAQLSLADDLRRRVHPLMSFFLAIFFIAVGTQMQIGSALKSWPSLLLLCAFLLIVVPVFTMWVTARLGYGRRTSFLTGIAMGQISELSFIFAAVGLATQMIDRDTLSLLTMLGLITIAISAFLIFHNNNLYHLFVRLRWLDWLHADAKEEQSVTESRLTGHIIIIGMNALGRNLAKQFHARGETVLALDTDQIKLADLPCHTMVGSIDLLSVVEEANLAQAKLAISALQIEDTNNLLAYRCKAHGVPVAIHAFDDSVFSDLRRLGVDFLIDTTQQGAVQAATQLYDMVDTVQSEGAT